MGKVYNMFEQPQEEPMTPIKSYKINRNDPCPCGSGKKYKKCCDAIKQLHPIDYYFEKISKEEDDEQIIQIVLEAEKDYPMEPAFFLTVTAHYIQSDQVEKALANLKKAWTVMGSDLDDVFIYPLITLMLENEEYFEARAIIEKVLDEKKNTPELILAYCETLKYSDEYDTIFSILDTALTTYPNNPDLLICKLESYMEMDQPSETLKFWKDNFSLFSDIEDVHVIDFLRSRLTDAFDLADDAPAEQVENAIDKLRKIFRILDQFEDLLMHEKFAEIQKHLKEIQTMVVASSSINMILIETYLNLGDYENIIELSKAIETHFLEDSLFYTFYSAASLETGDVDTALQQIDKAFTLALNEEEFDAWETFAVYLRILLGKNDPLALEKLLSHIPKITPDNTNIVSLLISILVESDYDNWIDELLQQLKQFPSIISPKNVYTEILYKLLIEFEGANSTNNSQFLDETIITIKKEIAAAEQVNITSPVLNFAKIRIGLIEKAAIASELETLLTLPAEYLTETLIKYEAILLYGDPQLILDNPPDLEMLDEASLEYHKLVANIILENWEEVQDSLLLTILEQANDNNFYEFWIHLLNYINKDKLFKVIDLLEFNISITQKIKDTINEFCSQYGYAQD